MSLLIVNTLPGANPAARTAIQELSKRISDCRIIHAYEMDIQPCAGCNFCWLRTPGICALQDGYEEILRGYLASDVTIFLAGTAMHFVDHRMKNIVDRLLPLATMYIRVSQGQCRHVPRYDKKYRFGLLYAGAADQDYLNAWMKRVMLNLGGESLGALPIERVREVISCI